MPLFNGDFAFRFLADRKRMEQRKAECAVFTLEVPIKQLYSFPRQDFWRAECFREHVTAFDQFSLNPGADRAVEDAAKVAAFVFLLENSPFRAGQLWRIAPRVAPKSKSVTKPLKNSPFY